MASAADGPGSDKLSWGRRAMLCIIVLNISGILVLLTAQLAGPSLHWLQKWTDAHNPYAFVKVTYLLAGLVHSCYACNLSRRAMAKVRLGTEAAILKDMFGAGESALWSRQQQFGYTAPGNMGKRSRAWQCFWESDRVGHLTLHPVADARPSHIWPGC